MRSVVEMGVVVGSLAVLVVAAEEGCSAGQQIKEATAEATYLGQQLACVDRSPSRELADECRREVRKRWGVSETVTRDGGSDG